MPHSVRPRPAPAWSAAASGHHSCPAAAAVPSNFRPPLPRTTAIFRLQKTENLSHKMPDDRPAHDLALGPFGTEQAGTEIPRQIQLSQPCPALRHRKKKTYPQPHIPALLQSDANIRGYISPGRDRPRETPRPLLNYCVSTFTRHGRRGETRVKMVNIKSHGS